MSTSTTLDRQVDAAPRRGGVLSLTAWAAVLTASALPTIVVTEISGAAPWWLPIGQLLVLLAVHAAVGRSTVLRPLVGVVRWLIAMTAGWHVVLGGVTATAAWQAWQHTVPWVARAAVVQALLFVPTLLLVALGPGRLGREQLRLVGGSDVPARPDLYTLGRPVPWRRLGAVWAVLITIGTGTAMFVALGSQVEDLSVLWWSLPAIAVLATTNTVNEEFGFRNVPLALLPPLVGRSQALLLTGSLFGLAHYYGNPPGASGVLLAGFLGILLAKSMVETGGSRWAWTIHWLQDVVIFSFLAAAWSSLG